MKFSIDRDTGAAIVGWIVLDDPEAIPKLKVTAPNGVEVELAANKLRERLKKKGLHSTGQVGFRIDETLVPGLRKLAEIEIRSVDTQIPIYRRVPKNKVLERKLFLLKLTALPQTAQEARCASRFAMAYRDVEHLPPGVLLGIIQSQSTTSAFVSGRVPMVRLLRSLKNQTYRAVALLRDPFEEMAERLLFARTASEMDTQDPALASYKDFVSPIADLAKSIDIADNQSIATAFEVLTLRQREVLSNPFVRVLACQAGEEAYDSHLAIALETLSKMDLVGIRPHYDAFKADLAELLGENVLGDHQLIELPLVAQFAARLARIRTVHELLWLDMRLYGCVKDAIAGVLAG
jgi:hypothetical protein